MTARACGSAKGARLPRNSGTTWIPPASGRPRTGCRRRPATARSASHSGSDLPSAAAIRLASADGGVEGDELVDGGARGGLAALVQPGAGDHRREVGPPDAGDEHRVAGGRHRAGRGAEDVGHAARRVALGADGADAAGVGVDQAGGDGVPGARPSAFAAALRSGRCRARCRGRRPPAPIRAKPSSASSPRPTPRK